MRKWIALPFGLIFVILLLATVVVFSLRGFAFDPKFYTTALRAQGLFQAVQDDPMTYFSWRGQLSGLNALPPDTQRSIFNAAVPSDWLEREAGGAIQNVIDWLNSDQPPPPQITLDFRPLKDRLQGPPGQQIANDIITAIPVCRSDQHPDLLGNNLPECFPAGFDRTAFVDYMTSVVNQIGADMPASLDVGPDFTSGGRWTSLITGRSWIRLLDVGLVLLLAVTFLLGFIGALIAGQDFKDGLRWVGGWLLAGSISALGLGVLMLIARDGLFSSASFIRSAGDNLTLAALTAIRTVAGAFVQQFAIRMIVPAGILCGTSLGLIVWGRNNPVNVR